MSIARFASYADARLSHGFVFSADLIFALGGQLFTTEGVGGGHSHATTPSYTKKKKTSDTDTVHVRPPPPPLFRFRQFLALPRHPPFHTRRRHRPGFLDASHAPGQDLLPDSRHLALRTHAQAQRFGCRGKAEDGASGGCSWSYLCFPR